MAFLRVLKAQSTVYLTSLESDMQCPKQGLYVQCQEESMLYPEFVISNVLYTELCGCATSVVLSSIITSLPLTSPHTLLCRCAELTEATRSIPPGADWS